MHWRSSCNPSPPRPQSDWSVSRLHGFNCKRVSPPSLSHTGMWNRGMGVLECAQVWRDRPFSLSQALKPTSEAGRSGWACIERGGASWADKICGGWWGGEMAVRFAVSGLWEAEEKCGWMSVTGRVWAVSVCVCVLSSSCYVYICIN